MIESENNQNSNQDRLDRARERMSADYPDDDAPRYQRRAQATRGGVSGLLGQDPMTRKLVYGALGLGGLLVAGVGGWSLVGHHISGIPVLGPPPGPVREKPKDPGGMQILGTQLSAGDGGGEAHLAPGPEQPEPEALARQYGQPAPSAAPASASPSVASAPQSDQADATGTDSQAKSANVTTPPAPPAGDQGVLPETPDGTAAPKVAPKQPLPPPAAPPVDLKPAAPALGSASQAGSATATPPVQADGAYGVQLAALNSEAAAQAEWERVTKQAPDLFAGRTPAIERVEHGGSVFFRLRTRGFATIAQATSFCSKVRQQGLACTLARF